jgi:hypothetical protein
MKPTQNTGECPRLTIEDAARIRELMTERERIVRRLRDLDAKEMAAMIPLPLVDLALQSITG